ncbi:hypothetical protein ACTSKR_10340 [Chitinibacteraceae bacterium HSL-7]
MQNQPPNQYLLGQNQRNASRDYKETHNYQHDIKHWELTASMQELDERAIQSEKFFRRRFGFDAPLEQRRDVIDLKNHLDLTDLEISVLKKAGLLTICKGKRTSLCADRVVFAMGVYFLATAIVVFGTCSLAILNSGPWGWKQVIGLSVVGLAFAVMLWFSSSISFHPLRIMQQRGIRLGQKWVLREHRPLLITTDEDVAGDSSSMPPQESHIFM